MLSEFSYTSDKMLRTMRKLGACALLALTLAACGFMSRPGTLFGGRATVEARMSDGLNGNRPVAVDLVVVYDSKLEKELAALTAEQWFAKRGQYLQVQPGTSLQVHNWQWVPGQRVPPRPIDYRLGALSTLVFASYAGEGDHRAQVAPDKDLVLLLGDDDFTVQVR